MAATGSLWGAVLSMGEVSGEMSGEVAVKRAG
ncbi:MAG: hypothetical protein ACI8UD_002487 [Planctomycetota bacterium]|jgi:hypothetical protein